jgi:hypothetical protein
MITRLMVIQKIIEDRKVEVFQISSDNFQWTFENRRTKIETDKEYYPVRLRLQPQSVLFPVGCAYKGRKAGNWCSAAAVMPSNLNRGL